MRIRNRLKLGRMAMAMLVVGGLVIGGAGSASASPVAPTGTPTPTQTCPPALPLFAKASSARITSVTISYTLLLSPPCGYEPPITFALFDNRDDAQRWLRPVSEVVSGPTSVGTVIFTGLEVNTEYWLRASAGGKADPYLLEPVRIRAGFECPTVVPFSLDVADVTSTTATISYSMDAGPPCGYDPPITLTFFDSEKDFVNLYRPVAQAVSEPTRQGKVTVTGLKADTLYWIRASFGGTPGELLGTTVRTAPAPGCTATVAIADQWDGGFIATVAVRNDGTDGLDGWRVGWRWSGDEKIHAMWNAMADVTGADVTAHNAPYNARLAPGDTATFGMVVAASAPPKGIVATCHR